MMVGSIVGCLCFGAAAFAENLITVVLLIGVGAGRTPPLPITINNLLFGSSPIVNTIKSVFFILNIGSAFVFPLLLSFTNIGHAFPASTASKFMSFITMGGGLAMIVTPYITNLLIGHFGWRGAFLMFSGFFFHLVPLGVAVKLNFPPADEKRDESKKFQCSDQTAVFKYGGFVVISMQMVLYGMFGENLR